MRTEEIGLLILLGWTILYGVPLMAKLNDVSTEFWVAFIQKSVILYRKVFKK